MKGRSVALAVVLLGGVCPPVAADFPQAVKDYAAGQYDTAHAEFMTLASLGDVASQFNLGAMAMQGQGGPKDLPTAVGWLTAAADNGSRQLAPEKLAAMRARLTADEVKTADDIAGRFGRANLLKTALPVPPLTARCANLVPAHSPQIPPGEYPWKGRMGDQNGFVIVQLTIGTDGVPRDPEVLMSVPSADFSASAINQWMRARFQPATQDGRPVESREAVKTNFSMTNGGVLWDMGALKTLRESALTGDPTAQYQIGLAATLDSSLGIPQGQAYKLLVSAAQGGNPHAQYWAGSRFLTLSNCIGENKSLPWLRAAAAAGDGSAQLALARTLLTGNPNAAQIAEARVLLQQAAESESYFVQKQVIALLAASPFDALRDPAPARAAAAKLMKSGVEADPQMYEAAAAADAASGDFWAAGNAQWTAVKRAREMHWNTKLMEERLALYRKSRPWTGELFAVEPAAAAPPTAGR
jgi:TonB family protein